MKAKIETGVFGAAPAIANLPTAKSTNDAVAVATAIGAIGGGVQRLLCSTSFYFGSLANGKAKFNFGPAWEGFYSKMYAANPMKPDSKKNAKKDACVYADFAQLKAWDTQEVAGRIFDHPHGSLSQKASAIRKVMDEHADEAPTDEELEAILPKPKSKSKSQPTTLKARTSAIYTSLASIRDDDDYAHMWEQIEGSDKLTSLFEKALSAVDALANAATAAAKAAKDGAKATKTDDATKARLAAIAKAAKEKPAKGARPS
jgi:hypothetical protein